MADYQVGHTATDKTTGQKYILKEDGMWHPMAAPSGKIAVDKPAYVPPRQDSIAPPSEKITSPESGPSENWGPWLWERGDDFVKTLPAATVKSAVNVATLPNWLGNTARQGVDYALESAGFPNLRSDNPDNQDKINEALKRSKYDVVGNALDKWMSTTPQDALSAVEKYTGPLHEPKHLPGQLAESVIGTAPFAAFGPGGVGVKALSAVGGGVGSELAGQALEGNAFEAPGTVLAGIAGATALPKAARFVVTPNPIKNTPEAREHARQAQMLLDRGDHVSASQFTGNSPWLGKVEGAAAEGGSNAARPYKFENQRASVTGHMMEDAGAPPNTLATDANIKTQKDALSADIKDITDKSNLHYNKTPDFRTNLGGLSKKIKQAGSNLSKEEREYLKAKLDDILVSGPIIRPGSNSSIMRGWHYQDTVSNLGEKIGQSKNSKFKSIAGEMRGLLDDAYERSVAGTPYEGAHKAWRDQYSNLGAIERAAVKNSDAGVVDPGAVFAKHLSPNSPGAQYARAADEVIQPMPGPQNRPAMDVLKTIGSGAGTGAVTHLLNERYSDDQEKGGIPYAGMLGGSVGMAMPWIGKMAMRGSGPLLFKPKMQGYLRNQAWPPSPATNMSPQTIARALRGELGVPRLRELSLDVTGAAEGVPSVQ